MTISGRYRFPTADCDNDKKEEMKVKEYDLRELENNIAERLFMPKLEKKVTAPLKKVPRTSLRQKSKREKEEALAKQHGRCYDNLFHSKLTFANIILYPQRHKK